MVTVSVVAVLLLLKAAAATAAMGILALGLIRMVLAAAAALAAHYATQLPLRPLVGWVGGFYLVALTGETIWLRGEMKRRWPAGPSKRPTESKQGAGKV